MVTRMGKQGFVLREAAQVSAVTEKLYTLDEIKTLAREFLQQSPLTDKLTPELILSSLIAWLARREKEGEQ